MADYASNELGGSEKGLDTGLLAFVQLLALNQLPADPNQILHDRGEGDRPFDSADMLRCSKRLGHKARVRSSRVDELPDLPLPAIGRGKDGEYFILASAEQQADAIRALVQTYDRREPQVWDEADLEQNWSGDLVLLTTRERLAGEGRRFDLTWFLPFVVKYRRPLEQVLAASFVIQIVALLSPIFFQLVIDKVLVHGTMATLDVLAIGLVVIFLWETALTGLRQWLLGHTTSRIDAELGSQLFRHMMGLPLAYFETRRVGDTVARVRELDQIREFLTGPVLSTSLDLLFTVVFLAVCPPSAPMAQI